jgi:FlaA1/EpsC-like NDP-sugar epimerase
VIVISRRTAVILHDVAMAALAWQLAWLARFNFSFPYFGWQTSLQVLPEVLLIQTAVFWFLGLYRGLWRFASIPDLWNIIKAAVLGTLLSALVLFIQLRLEGVPRSILILYPVFLILLLGGPRLAYRLWKDRRLSLATMAGNPRNVLIIGAGNAGETLARDMLREGQDNLIGFLDDKPALRGARVHGMPVFGGMEKLQTVVQRHDVSLIVIAIPSANSEQMRRIVGFCEKTGCPIRTLPRLQDMVTPQPGVNDLRDVSIEDLLGREPVHLDWDRIRSGMTGKRVLVTGGGGSIGSELCRQIANLSPASLVILERSEFNLYKIRQWLEREHANISFHPVLGDVCDQAMLNGLFEHYLPDIIFHAAAYKQVPLLEGHEREAVNNNVLGTMNVAMAADKHDCEKFVFISTDKAVNPVNVLGMSKRIAELYCEMMSRKSNTSFVTVRFGNVLGSVGSVIPLFREQIAAGGPVTVTHPDIERYFMTVQEACQLILQSAAMGQGGEIFVLDMGKPVKIAYLAEQMITLSGKMPGADVEIRFIGLRPGEKMTEELFYSNEAIDKTSHAKILLARHSMTDWAGFQTGLDHLQDACQRVDRKTIHTVLHGLISDAQARSQSKSNVISL